MSRYLLDARALSGPSGVRGIGTYVRGLLAGYRRLGMSNTVELLLGSGSQVPADLAAQGFRAARVRVPALGRRGQLLADPLLVSVALKRSRPTLYHAAEWGQPAVADVPVVLTVHDLIRFARPDLFGWRRALWLPALALVHRADAVIADSHATAADLIRLTKVRPDRLHVVHLAAAAHFRPVPSATVQETLKRLHIRGPYLLAVGTLDQRKRLGALIQVASQIHRRLGLQLVIAGAQGVFQEEVEARVHAAGLTPWTHMVAHVPDATLASLYSGAGCLVFTSAYEGFGLPPLEAMACGAPVVAFANSSIPEVVGDAAILVPDNQVGAMVEAVQRIASDPREAEARRQAGLRRAAQFSWEKTAAATRDVYVGVERARE